jgi:hypothetical protein
MGRRAICAVFTAILATNSASWACQTDAFDLSLTPDPIPAQPLFDLNLTLATAVTAAEASVTDPQILSWKQNITGLTGSSPNATINAIVSAIPADVQAVAYNSASVYIRASGVPSHPVGPFPGNPAAPSNRDRVYRIPRAPQQQTGTLTATGRGAIAVMANGVPLYSASDARSYNNLNIWRQNANVVEASSFDTGPGHPAPVMNATGNPVPGIYHYHQAPLQLIEQLDPGNTGQRVSPIIGFAFDGYPIYGPYGYANPDGTGGIERIESSYRLRNITNRTTLASGTALTVAQYGPAVGTQFPLGYYLEDFEYVAGLGDLDEFNGRFSITPDYPLGTYAYYAALDAAGKSAYPYVVGPNYYGVVATDNFAGNLTVPAGVTYFVVPEPCGVMLMAGLGSTAFLKRRRTALNRRPG